MATGGDSSTVKSTIPIQGTKYTVQAIQTNGTLDWNSLGTIMIKQLDDDVNKASRVDFRYGTGTPQRLSRSSMKTEIEWEYDHNKHGIMIFKKKIHSNSSFTCWMGRGIIDVPVREVAEFIKDVQNNMSWDNFLIEARYLKVLSQSDNPVDCIGYQRFEKTSCVVSFNRDLLYFVRCLYKGNKYIQAGLSINDPDFPPPQGVKRIEIRLGSGWVMEPYQGDSSKTLVSYVANMDLKGLPAFIMNQVLKRHPLALYYIRVHLTDPRAAISKSLVHGELSDDEETSDGDHKINDCSRTL